MLLMAFGPIFIIVVHDGGCGSRSSSLLIVKSVITPKKDYY